MKHIVLQNVTNYMTLYASKKSRDSQGRLYISFITLFNLIMDFKDFKVNSNQRLIKLCGSKFQMTKIHVGIVVQGPYSEDNKRTDIDKNFSNIIVFFTCSR